MIGRLVAGPALALVLAALAIGCGSSSNGSTAITNPFLLDPPNGTTLPEANVNQPYGQVFKVLGGGTPPYTFRPVSLPPGLSLVPQGGTQATLGGAPTQSGAHAVTFQVVDSTNAVFSSQSYSLKVN